MMSGMMLNGEHENAIGLFKMLESNGLKPDSATWKTIINELSQVGKNDEAILFFRKMQSVGEHPSMKCVISLLSARASIPALITGKEIHEHVIRTSRSCRIDEARELLLETGEASSSVLASLLCVCKFHSNVKHRKEIARLLVDLEPKSSTPFVILSNIYDGE
nr:pentatricopeptide repeat-containing protein At2g02750 [Tanacetum cinerariifolium]